MPRRIEPVFLRRTPLLFAHRGGAKEVPESTLMAFRYAIGEARSDVLEIDLQLTSDRRVVVWHGPELDNVRLACASPDPQQRREAGRFEIGHFSWAELERGAWVADPPSSDGAVPDLAGVPEHEERRLLPFQTFVDWIAAEHPDLPLNIELKEPFGVEDLNGFIDGLKGLGEERRVIVASNRNEALLERFRELTGGRYRTNLPAIPLGMAYALHIVGLLGKTFLKGRVVESPWKRVVTTNRMIRQVAAADSSTFVFLTGFPLSRNLDVLPEPEDYEARIVETLERGVDGVMTDRPKRVREIIDGWCARNP